MNFSQLELYIEYLISKSLTINQRLNLTFRILSETGLRINELNKDYFYEHDGEMLTMYSSKTGTYRLFNRTQFPVLFHDFFLSPQSNIVYNNASDINYYFSRYNFKQVKISLFHNTVSHIFRYYYCRKLYENGKSITEIASIMSHKTISVTNKYIFSEIKYI